MKILQIIIFNLFLCFSSFGQWEYLGTANIGRILKIEKDNGNLYAITYQDIYKRSELSESWRYLCGSERIADIFMRGISNFFVTNGNLYVILHDDTCSQFVIKSSDDGMTWVNYDNLPRGAENVFHQRRYFTVLYA